MRNRPLKLRALSLAALVFAVAVPAYAADAVPLDRRMPKTALVFVSVRNVPELTKRFNESNTGKLVSDPAVKDFREQLTEKFGELTGEFEGKFGMKVSELLALPQGEMAYALLTTKGKLASAWIMDFGEGRDGVLRILEKAASEVEKNMKRSEEEFEGTELVVFTPEKPEVEEGARPERQTMEEGLAWCIKDTHLIVASSGDTAKSLLRFWQEGSDAQPLAETETYKTVVERCRAGEDDLPPITWYIDPMGLVKTGATAAGPQGVLVLGFLPQLGLDKFRGVGGTFDLAAGEFDSVSRTMIVLDQPRKAVLNAVEFPSSELAPPKWVPADVAGYRQLNWNIEKAYSAVETIYDQFLGKGNFAKFVDEQARQNETVSLHYKKDIVDQLTGKLHIVSRSGKQPSDSPMLLALELKDQAAFQKVLGKLTTHPGFPGKRREFQGVEVWDLEAGEIKMGLAIAHQQFLFSTDVELIEGVLRGGDNSLADSSIYKEIAKRFPTATSYIGYGQTDSQYRDAIQLLKTQPPPGVDSTGLDFSKLPNFEDIKKYFTPGGSYMTSDDRGLFIVSFTLKDVPEGN